MRSGTPRLKSVMTVGLTFVLALAGVALPATGAQIPGLVKQKVKAKVQQEASTAIDTALNKATNGVKCVVSDAACIKKAKAAGKAVAVTDPSGKPVSTADSAAAIAAATGAPAPAGAGQTAAAQAPTAKPGEGVWANYDFVPGDRIIFFEDFASDNVGDFPRRFEFKGGNMEVVEWQGERYFGTNDGGGQFRIPLPEVLPDRFTVEFDYSAPGGQDLDLYFARGDGLNHVSFSPYASGVYGGDVTSGAESHQSLNNRFFRARIMADGHNVRVYMNQTRVANIPNANLGRANWIYVQLPPSGTNLIGNFTVAAGGKKLYDALAEQGRVATHGILFDTGSDQLRPESTPTLKQIGGMLTQHADLKLTIEGHTDNVGGDAANQALSEKRAAAVKQFLVSAYAIDAGRLTTKGLGASKPAGPNTTPEGRQNNRRVELVKM